MLLLLQTEPSYIALLAIYVYFFRCFYFCSSNLSSITMTTYHDAFLFFSACMYVDVGNQCCHHI